MSVAVHDDGAVAGMAGTTQAVILYEDAALGLRARQLLEQLKAHVGGGQAFQLQLWRFDVLETPMEAEAALRAAVEADLAIIACRSATPPPVWVMDWVEYWALCRDGQDAALVLMKEDDAAVRGIANAATAALSQIARRHGLTFFCDGDAQYSEARMRFIAGLRQREWLITPTLLGIIDLPASNSYRHWGIND